MAFWAGCGELVNVYFAALKAAAKLRLDGLKALP